MTAAALAALAAISAWLPAPVIGEGWGLNLGFNDLSAREQSLLSESGMKWVRRDLFWHVVEPEKGRWDWTKYDRLLSDLKPHGIRSLFILCYGNGLYQQDAPRTPEARAAFVRYVRQAVKRYRGRGIIWEMWNEPNNHHWQPRANVAEYIPLALETGRAFKQEAPNEILVGPALAGFDWPFVEACFKAGLLKYWDAVTVHPYRPMEPETALDDYARLAALIRRYAPPGKQVPILSGEWGFSDVNTGGEEVQGQWFVRQYLANLHAAVSLSIWYNFSDNGPSPTDPEHHFGVVGMAPEFRHKPAFVAARNLTSALKGFRYSKRIAWGGPEDWVLLFEKGGEKALVGWRQKPGSPGFSWPSELASGSMFRPGPQPQWAKFTGSALLERAARLPALPAALSVGSPAELAAVFSRFPRQGLRLQSGAWSAALRQGSSALAVAARAPRFSDRSHKPHQMVVTSQGIPQRMVLRHSAPIDVAWAPGARGTVTARITPQGAGFTGDVIATGSFGRRVSRRSARPGQTIEAAFPSSNRPIALTMRSNGSTVRSEGPLFATPLAFGSGRPVLEGDEKTAGSAAMATGKSLEAPLMGAAQAQVDYSFGQGWKYALVNPSAPIPVPGRPVQYSVWVKGDSSGGVLLMRYLDKTGQTFQPEGIVVDWKGWRLVSFPLDGSTGGRWGGANDGVVHLPARITTLAVIDNPRGAGARGRLVLAAPTVFALADATQGDK